MMVDIFINCLYCYIFGMQEKVDIFVNYLEIYSERAVVYYSYSMLLLVHHTPPPLLSSETLTQA